MLLRFFLFFRLVLILIVKIIIVVFIFDVFWWLVPLWVIVNRNIVPLFLNIEFVKQAGNIREVPKYFITNRL